MRRHAFFIGLFVFVAAARVAILFASQTHVHSDEAIIGLMGKHILEGRHFPFYMYGQPYNAGAAREAYLASVAFALFGVGVVPLKGCIAVLSLLCLFLFYRMGLALYDRRTAVFATLAFALTPPLLKWHYQVRGYSCYFLLIPLLTILFLSIQSTPNRGGWLFLLFGIVSGLSIWNLELGIAVNAALWVLLLTRRDLSYRTALAALAGFAIGYAPAIGFNLTRHFANWKAVLERTGGGFALLLHPEVLWRRYCPLVLPGEACFRVCVLHGRVERGRRCSLAFCSKPDENCKSSTYRFRAWERRPGSARALAGIGVLYPVRDGACACARIFFGRMFLFCRTHWTVTAALLRLLQSTGSLCRDCDFDRGRGYR